MRCYAKLNASQIACHSLNHLEHKSDEWSKAEWKLAQSEKCPENWETEKLTKQLSCILTKKGPLP